MRARKLRRKLAFNDMLGKGWDSGKQYSYCIQRAVEGDPQFWWVWDVVDKFPVPPPSWNSVTRGPGGQFKSFPGGGGGKSEASLRERIVRFACVLKKEGQHKAARRLLRVAQYEAPCLWCELKRPGLEPNITSVAVPQSRGICPECLAIMKAEMQKMKKDTQRREAQYEEPCFWCEHKRPDQEVNMVPVQTPGSHGMCRECFEIVKQEIQSKKR